MYSQHQKPKHLKGSELRHAYAHTRGSFDRNGNRLSTGRFHAKLFEAQTKTKPKQPENKNCHALDPRTRGPLVVAHRTSKTRLRRTTSGSSLRMQQGMPRADSPAAAAALAGRA